MNKVVPLLKRSFFLHLAGYRRVGHLLWNVL